MKANRNTREGYVPSNIESKWQEKWQADGLYDANIDPKKPKHYALTMLPYPSGDLHIGHWYAMTPSDARARFMRMNGFNVMFPPLVCHDTQRCPCPLHANEWLQCYVPDRF